MGVDDLLWSKVTSNGARIEVPLDAPGVCTDVFKNRKFVQVEVGHNEHVNHDAAEGVDGFVTRNMIACPVVVHDRVVAVIEVINKKDNLQFDKEDEKMLHVLADHVALFME